MILVDSSTWIDYFRGAVTPQTEKLDSLLQSEPLLIGDLILTEVLQGFADERDFERVLNFFTVHSFSNNNIIQRIKCDGMLHLVRTGKQKW